MFPAIASAAPATYRRRGSDFAELRRAVQRAALLLRRHGYYAVKCGLTVAVFAAAWVVFGYVGDSWWLLFTAAAFEDDDSDLDTPALAQTKGQGRAKLGFLRCWMAKYQAFLFFPLLLVAGLTFTGPVFKPCGAAT